MIIVGTAVNLNGTYIVVIFLEVLHGSSSKMQLRNSDSSRKSIEKGRGMHVLFVGGKIAKHCHQDSRQTVCAYCSLY